MTQHVFKYGFWIRFLGHLFLAIIVLVVAAGTWVVVHRGEVTNGILIILVFDGLFIPLYINAKLMYSTLRVDDQGVTAMAFGHAWRSIRWKDVKAVRWGQLKYPDSGEPYRVFFVRPVDRNFFYLMAGGPISFRDNIVDFQLLFETVREKAATHGFPIARLGE